MRILPLSLAALMLTLYGCAGAVAQEMDYVRHFTVYTADGESASLEDIVRAMWEVDVVMVGESHNDPVGHWIESAQGGAESGRVRPVVLSLEMFERDVQGIVDEYLQDLITEEQFKDDARPWKYYDEDYRPMVELAREAGIPVIAANAPRRYVNRVTRLGRDALHDLGQRAREYLPPLPYPQASETYRNEWLNLMAEMPMERVCPAPEGEEEIQGHPVEQPQAQQPAPARAPTHMASFMENGLQAQALWDASMAHAITTQLELSPGALVLHMVGGFHVENHTGIPEQVQHYRPGTRTLVVALELADDYRSFDPAEHAGRGDFVVLTDRSLDLDYARNCGPAGIDD